jgi:cellobiose-specific phosphotransferase system component IIC
LINTVNSNQKNKTHMLLTPMLGSLIWVGGGSAGLVLLIVLLVLLLR